MDRFAELLPTFCMNVARWWASSLLTKLSKISILLQRQAVTLVICVAKNIFKHGKRLCWIIKFMLKLLMKPNLKRRWEREAIWMNNKTNPKIQVLAAAPVLGTRNTHRANLPGEVVRHIFVFNTIAFTCVNIFQIATLKHCIILRGLAVRWATGQSLIRMSHYLSEKVKYWRNF